MLSTKLIEIIHDMWIQRNNILHQHDNIITDTDHKWINEQIQTLYEGLPANRQLWTHSEDNFFRAATSDIVKKRILRHKKQWVKKARAISLAISCRQNQRSTQLLYGAMRINHQNTNANPPSHTTHHIRDLNLLYTKIRRMQRDTGWLICFFHSRAVYCHMRVFRLSHKGVQSFRQFVSYLVHIKAFLASSNLCIFLFFCYLCQFNCHLQQNSANETSSKVLVQTWA